MAGENGKWKGASSTRNNAFALAIANGTKHLSQECCYRGPVFKWQGVESKGSKWIVPGDEMPQIRAQMCKKSHKCMNVPIAFT